jgi:hypothetical protein
MIDMHDYEPAARRYWWTLVVMGGAALLFSAYRLLQLDGAMKIPCLLTFAACRMRANSMCEI